MSPQGKISEFLFFDALNTIGAIFVFPKSGLFFFVFHKRSKRRPSPLVAPPNGHVGSKLEELRTSMEVMVMGVGF